MRRQPYVPILTSFAASLPDGALYRQRDVTQLVEQGAEAILVSQRDLLRSPRTATVLEQLRKAQRHEIVFTPDDFRCALTDAVRRQIVVHPHAPLRVERVPEMSPEARTHLLAVVVYYAVAHRMCLDVHELRALVLPHATAYWRASGLYDRDAVPPLEWPSSSDEEDEREPAPACSII